MSIPFKIDGAFEVAGDISNPGYLLVSNIINIISLFSGLTIYSLFLFKKYKFPVSRFKAASLVLFVLFFCLDLFSRRFSDYLTPVMLIFISLHIYDFAPLLKKMSPLVKKYKYLLIALLIVLFIGFSFVFYNKYLKDNFTNTDYRGDKKSNLPEPYQASLFIDATVPPGSYIYNDAWEDFPYFIYYAVNYKYASGMELGFMYLYNADMLKFYQDFRANVGFEDTGTDLIYSQYESSFKDYIQTNFKSNLIVMKKGSTERMSNFLKDNYSRLSLSRVFDDDYYSIYSF